MNEKSILCVFQKNCFKDNVKTVHCVGHLQLISLDTDDLFKSTPVVDNIQASLTGNTMKQSNFEKKGIHIYYNKKKKM